MWEGWVPGDFVLNVGGWITAFVSVLFLVMRGLLVPKRTIDWSEGLHTKLLEEKEKRIVYLESALTTEQQSVSLLSRNQEGLLRALDINNALIEGVQRGLERRA